MKVSAGIRSAAAVTATALAVGLGVLAAAAPAEAQPAKSATLVPTATLGSTTTTSAAAAPTVLSCIVSPTGVTGAGDGSIIYPVLITDAVNSCVLNPTLTFSNGGKVSVAFSNGLSAELVMQGDGNLCWYVTAPAYTTRWCSKTNVLTDSYASWQGDGNLVVYGTNSKGSGAKWSSGTNGKGEYLALQSDGNLVIYGPNSAGVDVVFWAAF